MKAERVIRLNTNGVRVSSVGLFVIVLLASSVTAYAVSVGRAAQPGAVSSVTVDGRVALASLMSLSDGHLLKMADSLGLVAASDEAKSADWERVKSGLAKVRSGNVPALLWFALPDGSYWTLEKGRTSENLANRAYFPRLLAGKRVVGDLVVSKATGKSAAIVAVPIMKGRSVVGALGSSVYLDRLSADINREMDLGNNIIFYSFDSEPLVALNWDPTLVFLRPMQVDNESLRRAFREMLSKNEGMVTYVFRDKPRTILYKKSPVTNWWYAFGIAEGGR